jgi:exodeoxyribonuclease VII large subunit
MKRATHNQVLSRSWGLERQKAYLQQHTPIASIRTSTQRLDEYARRLNVSIDHWLQYQRAHLGGLEKQLTSLDPQAVLKRGYAIVSRADGSYVLSIAHVQPSEHLTIRMQDGTISVIVQNEIGKDQ